MSKIKNNSLIFSLLLITFLSMLAYLPLTPLLGFYSDDFFFSYVAHFYGPTGLIKSLVIDRPFNGYLLNFYYFVLSLRDNAFIWHIFIFFIRLAGGYALFFALKKIWPNKLSEVTFITLLFLLYPGFLQQTLPLGFGGWITTLTLWTFSLAFTVAALKDKNKYRSIFSTILALVLQINSFLQLEFFIGMEVLRFLLIIHILKIKITPSALKKKIISWSPYLTTALTFIFWRIFVFKSTRPETDINMVAQTYYSDPFWLIKLPLELFISFLHTLVFAYIIPIAINFIRLPLQDSIIAIALGAFSLLIIHLYFKNINKDYDDKTFGKWLFLIGLISTIAAVIPIIISGRTIRIFNVLDRYTITAILGVSLALSGFLIYKISPSLRKIIFVSLITISIISHLMNGFWHKVMWDRQKDLWWQLYWRAPSIEKNAMLVLDFPPISKDIPFKTIINKVQWYRFYWVEEQIWTAGNLFLNYNNPPADHFYGDFLQGKGVLEKIKEGSSETFSNRNIIYTRDFKKSMIIATPSDISCLKILDGDKLVKTGFPVTPPKQIFGDEPPHNWCYYFQKASLAKQLKDWDKLAQLKKEVTEKNLRPKDPNEWLPFERDMR